MKVLNFLRRRDGVSAVEFAMVGPIFISLMLAIFQGGMMLWTQLGLEHAVEAAARCSAVNASTCGSASEIQAYAATQAYGLNLPASTFSYSQSTCGNLVSASYTYPFFSNVFESASMPLKAEACFPT
ncbi:pilus assembly protein [Rhodoblastus acidophilus]|uniref:Pilus assembly protein n=1 Tax=Candidatus Rhodoblastus alkanivorans TaxID=2954117 RepID=A0ABS9Z6I5_9HYPH|nr:TadE/TadG family type IV pilus assembly protein [Candidatus Rhodoblastus alkanivorans]MCI4680117.1 pilus assembly protein [Candidatus Rhodoblastus alkanivorans]MCI4682995.1 pilus assembly protein [Candidatus Rhodoblastus alkanivorans]MDI4640305.1 pilus assembly protein [Rhodoblastus acidophilus]